MVADDPLSAANHIRLGKLMQEAGDLAGAAAALRAGIARLPKAAHLHSQLGQVLTQAGLLTQAEEAFRDAVAADPGQAGMHALLSRSLAKLSALDEAILCIRRAIALRPDNPGFDSHLETLLQHHRAAGMPEPRLPETPLFPDPARPDSPRQRPTERPFGPEGRAAWGQDGWLFHCVDDAFGQICRAGALDDTDLVRLLSIWKARQAWCAVRHTDYRILIVPERHVLYPDKLPDGYAPHAERPVMRVLQAADAILAPNLVYPVDRLTAGRATSEVCYRMDVHWTRYGAYLAYRALLETLPNLIHDVIPERALTVRERRGVGDMALWIGDRTREISAFHEPPKVAVREVFTNRTFKPGQVDVLETENAGAPRLVLFRTSNSTSLLPFLYKHFSRIVAVASVAVHYDLLRDEKPDVVISELPERYLAKPARPGRTSKVQLPRDVEHESFLSFTGVPLPLPGSRAGCGKRPGALPLHPVGV